MNYFVTEGECCWWGWGGGGEITFRLGKWSSSSDLGKNLMNMLLEPKNKLTEQFVIFLKIQDGSLRSKLLNQPNLTQQITFWLSIWILFFWFGQNLAWIYYLTLETSLLNNFSFFSKTRMAAEVKIEFQQFFGSKMTYRLWKQFPFIRFGQNWNILFDLETNLCFYLWKIQQISKSAITRKVYPCFQW